MTPWRIMIATPVLSSVPGAGELTVHYQMSLLRMVQRFSGLAITSSNAYVNTDLVRARSRAVRAALDGCFTHLLFWDSDVGGTCADALHGMLSSRVDLIACPYPRKRLDGRGSHEPPFVAMGFTLISERCMRLMWDAYYDDLHFDDVIDGKPHRTVALFQLTVTSIDAPHPHRILLGEDYAFCERWLRLGEEIHLYQGPGAPLEHVGSHIFTSPPAQGHP